jgi:pimeloyl-ACP methyl ester carboxylesterase
MNSKGQMIETNGIRLNVLIHGDGPDVLLLHGFPDSAYLWRKQIPALAEAGYRVIAPDLRGSGLSDAPEGRISYTLDKLIKDVSGLLDHLGVKRTRVVGHDWGAILGWFFVIEHPEYVDRYVALSVGHPTSYQKAGIAQKLRSWYAFTYQPPAVPEILSKAFNWRLTRVLTRNHSEMDRWIEDKARPGRLTAAINWYRANLNALLFGSTPHAKVPVFGIWSSGDIYLTERQMTTSEKYVDAPWRYERIENSSHWIPLDAPDRLNALLLEYFRESLS